LAAEKRGTRTRVFYHALLPGINQASDLRAAGKGFLRFKYQATAP
jgi:hypothetical protein